MSSRLHSGNAYIEKFKQLEEEELRSYSRNADKEPDHRRKVTELDKICTPEMDYKYPILPILNQKDELISLVENNSVVIVQGATGCGKSTQLPQFILDYYMQRSRFCNIVVTQPRKIGACSIATWISKERKWPLSGLVGYQVGLDKKATNDTRLIYMTTGVLLQKIVGVKSLAEFTHIFIDEVHERTEEMDFLLIVVRKLLLTNSRLVKVILMSATMNCKEFADYFAVPVFNRLNPAYIIEVEGKPHDIEVYYLDDLKHIPRIKAAAQYFDEPAISREIYEFATSLIQLFDDMEMKENGNKINNPKSITEPNSVLVFLPGLAEINCMHELFTNMVHKRLHVYPLHSSITLDEQNLVFMTPVLGYRKIILSTNIAESSITVPDVKYVIDFCLTKTLVCDEETNYQSLRLSWASKTNCDQRKGRAGRVSKGYCYRLVLKDFWKNFIPENVVPEMLRRPLGNTILKVKLLNMGEPRALLATALSPPHITDIERTILLLKEVGALAVSKNREEENPYDGELTFLGQVIAQLPVDLQLGKLIFLGHVFGCLEECVIIAAALSLKNFFAMPYMQHLDGYRNKLSFSGNSRSDCIALVDAFKNWQACKESGELRLSKNELDWGKSNYFQVKRLREVNALFEELKMRISQFNMHVTQRPAMDPEYKFKQRFILQVVMAGAFYPNYFTFVKPDEEMAIRELGGKDPKTTIMLKNIPLYGFLYHKQIQSLFRQCGQVKSILFDGSKAFVEFTRSPTERFKTLSAVYMALKMAQLKVPLTLNVQSAEGIEEKSEAAITILKQIRVNVDFHKQTVDPVHVSHGILEQSGTIKGLILSINVTEVVEVGHFWGFRINGKNQDILGNLTTDINRHELTPLARRPHPNLMCLAPFTDTTSQRYYRAQILYISGDSAEVFFVDYGNRSKVALDLLKEIPSDLLQLDFQALEFKICKMRPSAMSIICGEQWSHGASERFSSLVYGCTVITKVYSIVHNILNVDVYRHFEDLEDISIRDLLIADGYAEQAEESYESKQSNEGLKDLFLTTEKNRVTPVCSVNEKEEKALLNSLLENSSGNQLGAPNCKVLLHGAYNPYEVQFHSMVRTSKFRCVRIEKESINSVVVNDTPEEVHQRMFVAASLSVNASGSTILLRETSLLPSIPGLPALISMLFAPLIELRVDRSRRDYTGVLCGLGCHHESGTPIWAEHDMELAFDVQFTVDDLVKINLIRSAINKFVCHDTDGFLNLRHEKTARLQEDVREKLLSLIHKEKPRAGITPRWYEKLYQWNQVDPKLLIDQSRKPDDEGKTFLYQLHKLIMLNI
ncbi:ATP-dependent RNA helicase TDRD9 isoform X2 [Ascaphus truei]|uniref:ATP-dependent RNA helicase TDRD9 isoform X2 n=1 Tax=Ascaphus truei TaxID=8439 RepID=UPI003F5AA65A